MEENKYQIRILFNLYIYINYTFTKLAFILFWYHFLSVNLKFVIHQAWVNNKGHLHIRVSCDQQLLIAYKQISYDQIVYQLFKTSWIFNLIWHSRVTEISITTDRKEQVMLFIIMVASFTYNLIKLVLGPMEIFFIIWIISLTIFSQICIT